MSTDGRDGGVDTAPRTATTGGVMGHGYWYATGEGRVGPVDVLALLRRYREVEQRRRERTRASMKMGENDVLALRYLLAAKQRGEVVRQKALADALRITGASVSALVDRLVRDGYARRLPHPDDRRSVAIETTQHSDDEVRATLGGMHERMLEATERLSQGELDAVAGFLEGLIDAVEHEGAASEPSAGSDPSPTP